MKTELEINKVDTEASKDAEIKRVQKKSQFNTFFYRR